MIILDFRQNLHLWQDTTWQNAPQHNSRYRRCLPLFYANHVGGNLVHKRTVTKFDVVGERPTTMDIQII